MTSSVGLIKRNSKDKNEVELEDGDEDNSDLRCRLSSRTQASTSAYSVQTAHEWTVAAAEGLCKECMVGAAVQL